MQKHERLMGKNNQQRSNLYPLKVNIKALLQVHMAVWAYMLDAFISGCHRWEVNMKDDER